MINKAILMRKITKTTDLSLREASSCIDAIVDTITDELSRGGKVELRGFGTFSIRYASSKKYPSSFSSKTDVPEHWKVSFKPCQKLKESVWNLKRKPVAAPV